MSSWKARIVKAALWVAALVRERRAEEFADLPVYAIGHVAELAVSPGTTLVTLRNNFGDTFRLNPDGGYLLDGRWVTVRQLVSRITAPDVVRAEFKSYTDTARTYNKIYRAAFTTYRE